MKKANREFNEATRRILSTPRWLEPPSGRKYGFPRLWVPTKDGPLDEFLIHHGYPEEDVEFACHHSRFWEATEEDLKTDNQKKKKRLDK